MKPYYQDDLVTLYHGDCREVLPELAYSHVLTDPPYGIGWAWARGVMAGKRGTSRLWGKGETWDDEPADQSVINSLVSAPGVVIVWGGHYYRVPPARCWLIWDKCQSFSGADAELAWTNLKDSPVRTFRLSRIDAYQNKASEPKTHPTQKPLQLLQWCLSFVPAGGVALDPFCGTGGALVAAKANGRPVVGIEINEAYCEIAANRLRQGSLSAMFQ